MRISKNYMMIEKTGFRLVTSMAYQKHYFRKGDLIVLYSSPSPKHDGHSLRFHLRTDIEDTLTVSFTSSEQITEIIKKAESKFLKKM